MGHDDRPPTADETEHDAEVDAERIHTRSTLLPEEQVAGESVDPEEQAKIILEDSEERTEHPGASPTTFTEHRTSDETV